MKARPLPSLDKKALAFASAFTQRGAG